MEWLDWLAGACYALPGVLGFHPLPGTRQHRELTLRVRREFNEERFKPAEQRDPERVRQLRIQDLRLGIEEGEVNPLLALCAAADSSGGAATPLFTTAGLTTASRHSIYCHAVLCRSPGAQFS